MSGFDFRLSLAQVETRTAFQWNPLLSVSEWWQSTLLVLVAIGLVVFILWLYRRDNVDMPIGVASLLCALRLTAFGGLFLFFFQPQLRSESLLTKPSRVAVLVDNSLSMGLRDQALDDSPRRIDRVIENLKAHPWLKDLASKHDVTVYRFGDEAQPIPILQLPKSVDAAKTGEGQQPRAADPSLALPVYGSRLRIAASVMLGLALFLGIVGSIIRSLRRRVEPKGWWFSGTIASLVVCLILFASGEVLDPRLVVLQPDVARSVPTGVAATQQTSSAQNAASIEQFDWSVELAPRGPTTRLGHALLHIVNKERGGSIAGIVLITDGGQNSGVGPDRAIAAAQSANLPIYAIGIGSPDTPRSVQLVELQAPPRAFPGDKFKVKGMLQAFGMSGENLCVRLLSTDESASQAESIEDELHLRAAADGELVPVEFELQSSELGKRRFIVRVIDVIQDLDPADNQRSCIVDVVDRKTNVLLIAGGPMRDFHFLRNQLYRDKEIDLQVWLQSAREGADQDTAKLLADFPTSREELFSIDCIIAFDPDWRRLTAEQSKLLEQWIAEQAGGLIVIAGPVNTPEWTRVPRGDAIIDPIRGIYPVSFYNQGSAVLKLGRFGGEQAYPLEFTREGTTAEFLWLGDDPSVSAINWARFAGVFGYYAVNESKSGADVLAHFSDPATSMDDRLPIYLASQYYGSGRVVFQASGEIWRLRSVQVEFFQQYYSKLIRWVSQGRLLRDSSRGMLVAERQRYWLGDQVVVSAMVRDEQDNPLMLPSVRASVSGPENFSTDFELARNPEAVRGGQFSGSFVASREGDYRIRLPVAGGSAGDILTTQITVSIPDLERRNPQRNDSLLSEIAEKTNGHFFAGFDAAIGNVPAELSLVGRIVPQDQQSYLPGVPDGQFHRRLMAWLLITVTILFCVEWIVRRLHKLA